EWDLVAQLTAFDRANRKLRKELAQVEERTRRRDILLDDEALFEFYDRRIPAEVCTQRDFEKWWKEARSQQPDLLTMTVQDLQEVPVPELVEGFIETDYPKHWNQGDQRLKLTYRFEPGAEDDGVTVHVPIALLARLSAGGFDWQVPSLRTELVTAMIKSLPKAIRRNVVPAADWAARLMQDLPADAVEELSLTEYLAAQIQRQT